MKHFKKIVLVAIATLCISTLAIAQREPSQSYIDVGGLMVGKDAITIEDMFEISQTQFNFGTARSMAMAGAFTSLGADLSSMSTNPAGLGMYRGNDFSITPLMTFQRATNSANSYGSNRENTFSMSNFGVALNVYEGKGSVVSVTLGLGYNRVQDLNYNYTFDQIGNTSSIADAYSKMLDYSGISPNDVMADNVNWNRLKDKSLFWPAILGYGTGLTDYLDDSGEWWPTRIGGDRSELKRNPDGSYSGIDIGQSVAVESIGSIGEYSIAMGLNISNKLYIGATIGIQNVYQKKNYFYGEDYYYAEDGYGYATDGGGNVIPEQLINSYTNQTTIVDGTGVNFKLGLTYRPIHNLRIAVAVHTPTYYSLDREYQAYASSNFVSNLVADEGQIYKLNDETIPLTDDGEYGWSFTSPTRILLGASYTFGHWGLISVDYQRDWYSNMRLKDSPIGLQNSYKNSIKDQFKGSNTLRVGLEIKPLPILAVRGGFGYSGSWLQDESRVTSSPITESTTYLSAGIGLMLSRRTYLDFAYSYQTYKQTDYRLYYVNEFNADGSEASSNRSNVFSTDLSRHNAAITFGVRF